jgi:Secretion system C-terminal sorting domain
MKNVFLSFQMILLALVVHGQMETNNWIFGANAQFHSYPPSPFTQNITTAVLNVPEGSSTASSADGTLLFYTDGNSVWGSNHVLMPNGAINGSGNFGGVNSSTQGSLIIQNPYNCNIYYIFTTPDQGNYDVSGLKCFTVDMTVNAPFGDVLPGVLNLLDGTTVGSLQGCLEGVTACVHNNGVDIWVIAHEGNNNRYVSFLINSMGVNTTPVVSAVGQSRAIVNNRVGTIKANHSGTQIAATTTFTSVTCPNGLELFAFNNSTGVLTFTASLLPYTSVVGAYGIEYSQNDALLYYTDTWGTNQLVQVNTVGYATTVIQSGTPGVNYEYGNLQLAYDGTNYRIIMATRNLTTLGAVLIPATLGGGCGYNSTFITLTSGTCKQGLPNFAPYLLGSKYVNPCAKQTTQCKAICKTNDKDFAQQMIKTSDGGIAMSGTYFETLSTDKDMYVAKLNAALLLANPTSARRVGDFSTVKNETGFDIIQGSDGFIYVAGAVEMPNGFNDVLVSKHDPVTLLAIWVYNYGLTSSSESATVIVESEINTTNNKPNFVIGGNRSVGSPAVFDAFVFKIDADGVYNSGLGTLLFSGPSGTNEFIYNGIKTSAAGGEIVLVGEQAVGSNSDFMTFRISTSTLNLVSGTSYYIGRMSATSFESVTGLVEIQGSLFMSGLANYTGNNTGIDAMLVKLPNNFTTASLPSIHVYGKTSALTCDEVAMDICATTDNNHVILAGWKKDPGSASAKDGLVFKVNISTFAVVWSKSLFSSATPYTQDDAYNDIVLNNNGQVVVCGFYGISSTDSDIFYSLLEADGVSCCHTNYPLNPLNPTCSLFNSLSKTAATFVRADYLKDVFSYCTTTKCTTINSLLSAEDENTYGEMNQDVLLPDLLSLDQNVIVKPNPGNGHFVLSLKDDVESIQYIEIFDLSGKLVNTIKAGEKVISMNVSMERAQKGIYFVVVHTQTQVRTTKIVVNE